ncbi:hypothetical protein QYF61_009447 [Mycteria americana]|uniref:Uncharacterized protein n=1 Tax=Mycteria americana TaxID=33587 RepID=A0AAN7S6B5_MYCAM|nr:hypothetical protein QYF61_009447 [Mycteria americana]
MARFNVCQGSSTGLATIGAAHGAAMGTTRAVADRRSNETRRSPVVQVPHAYPALGQRLTCSFVFSLVLDQPLQKTQHLKQQPIQKTDPAPISSVTTRRPYTNARGYCAGNRHLSNPQCRPGIDSHARFHMPYKGCGTRRLDPFLATSTAKIRILLPNLDCKTHRNAGAKMIPSVIESPYQETLTEPNLMLFTDTCVVSPNPHDFTTVASHLVRRECVRDPTCRNYYSPGKRIVQFKFRGPVYPRVCLQCKI